MFALWTPSRGADRLTALINLPLFPEHLDRQIHGNVSFNRKYLQRACQAAIMNGAGVAFLHSHPFPGWQRMSADDVAAEKRMVGIVESLTALPLVGLTVGNDGTWSARAWQYVNGEPVRKWAESVRSVGLGMKISHADHLNPPPEFSELFRRSATIWGENNHATLARLHIGIVGLGSVGMIVAETLARMGLQHITIIDYDEVQPHNLDRLLGASRDDVGDLKINVARRQIMTASTAKCVDISCVPYSIAEEPGYQAALDCDVLFSCVDRPRPRRILNHLAYAHMIPVVDGGIKVKFDKAGLFIRADWQLQTVAPCRPCLECLGAYYPSDVSLDEAGMLDDPTYLDGLSEDHYFKRNENVFPFSANLASLEVLQFIALLTGIGNIRDFGVQRYRYMPGIITANTDRACREGCIHTQIIGRGDIDFCLYGSDVRATEARTRQAGARGV